jgi:hypothetical protein
MFFQGMGMIVATYLLLMEEEDAFWMMVATVEDLLPSSYYSPSLIGVQADQVQELIFEKSNKLIVDELFCKWSL